MHHHRGIWPLADNTSCFSTNNSRCSTVLGSTRIPEVCDIISDLSPSACATSDMSPYHSGSFIKIDPDKIQLVSKVRRLELLKAVHLRCPNSTPARLGPMRRSKSSPTRLRARSLRLESRVAWICLWLVGANYIGRPSSSYCWESTESGLK